MHDVQLFDVLAPPPEVGQLIVRNGDGTATISTWMLEPALAAVMRGFLQMMAGAPHASSVMPIDDDGKVSGASTTYVRDLT